MSETIQLPMAAAAYYSALCLALAFSTAARATSARRRPQTFLKLIFVALEEAPYRAATAGNPSLVHHRDDFTKRHVRVPSNQHKQKTPRALPTGLHALIAELGLTSNQSAASAR